MEYNLINFVVETYYKLWTQQLDCISYGSLIKELIDKKIIALEFKDNNLFEVIISKKSVECLYNNTQFNMLLEIIKDYYECQIDCYYYAMGEFKDNYVINFCKRV